MNFLVDAGDSAPLLEEVAVIKVPDMARPDAPCGGQRRNAATRPLIVGGFLKGLNAYREMVDVEIGRSSDQGARWWSRRLVEMSEEAGLLRLDD